MPHDLAQTDAKKTSPRLRLSSTLILFIFLVVMALAFSLISRDFYSVYNIKSMLTNVAFTGIVAAALTLVMISGGIDISVGGNIALTSCLLAYLYNMPDHLPVGVIIGAAILLGALIGAFNGLLITRLNLDPIITTLGTMAITRGIAYVITHGRSMLILEDVTGFIGRSELARVPVPLILFAIIYILLAVVLGKSKFGRKIYYIGANQQAAHLSGINVRKTKLLLYLLTGIAASISGIILTGQTAVGMPQHATGTELEVITAVLLGGTALAGGKGTIAGTLAGVLILAVLYNGFTMIGFRYVHIRVFQGILLILIVALYEVRKRKT